VQVETTLGAAPGRNEVLDVPSRAQLILDELLAHHPLGRLLGQAEALSELDARLQREAFRSAFVALPA
jgi:hypothetical protein